MNNDRTEEITMTIQSTNEPIDFDVVGGFGTSNYERLSNKPHINSVELIGNKTSEDLGLQPAGDYLTEETDPIFSASPSSNITNEDITNWNNKSDFSGSYEDLTDKPDIPSKTSDLTNDSGYIDKSVDNLDNYTKTSDLSAVATSGNYNDLSNKPTIPDVSSFITKDVNNLTYYTLKTSTGSLIDLEVNSSTYVVTLYLKDIDGNVISTDSIDLPLESVVVSGSFDSTNKKIVLTLQNGNTVDIPVGDLVAGLQTEITSTNKIASDLIDDSNSGNKFTNASEKQAWNNKYDKPIAGIPASDLASGVIPDLTNYVTKTDYATSSVGGVIKSSSSYGTNTRSDGTLASIEKTYEQYTSASSSMFVSKGTLENVITGKDLTTKSYVDGLVGDIDTALDLINGEVIS